MPYTKNIPRKFPESPINKIVTFRKLVVYNTSGKIKSAKSIKPDIKSNSSVNQRRLMKDSEEIFGLFS